MTRISRIDLAPEAFEGAITKSMIYFRVASINLATLPV